MPSTRQAAATEALHPLDRVESPGCRINTITVEELFARYTELGLLYPTKMERLRAHWPLVTENWRRSMSDDVDAAPHRLLVHQDTDRGAWASVGFWLHTPNTVHSQHLVSCGRPESTRAVLLEAQIDAWRRGALAAQNWYRAENRLPARVFGSAVQAIGAADACAIEQSCLALPRATAAEQSSTGLRAVPCGERDSAWIARAATALCGGVVSRADEWDSGDVGLEGLDERYRRLGLRRYRRVWTVEAPGHPGAAGLAVAYRGPLGLSFSLLENRCELWLHEELDDRQRAAAAVALLRVAAEAYNDHPLPWMLVTTDRRSEAVVMALGATLAQRYTRTVWLRAGFHTWFAHIERLYARIMEREHRQRQPAAPGSPA